MRYRYVLCHSPYKFLEVESVLFFIVSTRNFLWLLEPLAPARSHIHDSKTPACRCGYSCVGVWCLSATMCLWRSREWPQVLVLALYLFQIRSLCFLPRYTPRYLTCNLLSCCRNTGITDDCCCAWLCMGARELNTVCQVLYPLSHRVRFKWKLLRWRHSACDTWKRCLYSADDIKGMHSTTLRYKV